MVSTPLAPNKNLSPASLGLRLSYLRSSAACREPSSRRRVLLLCSCSCAVPVSSGALRTPASARVMFHSCKDVFEFWISIFGEFLAFVCRFQRLTFLIQRFIIVCQGCIIVFVRNSTVQREGWELLSLLCPLRHRNVLTRSQFSAKH